MIRLASKPQYALHPLRAMRRLTSKPPVGGGLKVARLPWRVDLIVSESDAIGYSILVGRVFDPCVTETIHRLIDPGDFVVDVGANVGYLTSLAAVRAGPRGRVVAVEPHPTVFELLSSNAEAWRADRRLAPVELQRLALSDRAGDGRLFAGPTFDQNMGLATLASDAADGPDSEQVELRRLDEVVPGARIGVLKIDVEGHEPEVLRGAGSLLEGRLVRDVIFEDHEPYPSKATETVERAGYHLVSLTNDLGGLRLQPPGERGDEPAWPGPSYLATADPARSIPRLERRGWQVEGIGISAPVFGRVLNRT